MRKDDDVIHAGPLGPRVLTVCPIAGHRLSLTFDNGEKRIFDAKPLLSVSAFKPLRNENFFNMVKTEFGTVVWPHNIDYCPDTLYSQSVPAKEQSPYSGKD